MKVIRKHRERKITIEYIDSETGYQKVTRVTKAELQLLSGWLNLTILKY